MPDLINTSDFVPLKATQWYFQNYLKRLGDRFRCPVCAGLPLGYRNKSRRGRVESVAVCTGGHEYYHTHGFMLLYRGGGEGKDIERHQLERAAEGRCADCGSSDLTETLLHGRHPLCKTCREVQSYSAEEARRLLAEQDAS